jgi:hypothetical protein
MADLDPRGGNNLIVWITATRDGQVLSSSELAAFAARAGNLGAAIRVTDHDTIACIGVCGDHTARNAALETLGEAFYAAGVKWIRTTGDFKWLRAQLGRAQREQ